MKSRENIENNSRISNIGLYPNGGTATIRLQNWKGTVVWSIDEEGLSKMEHVSVAPFNHKKMPSWDDMCKVKDMFWEDEDEVYQIHPKKSQYVNQIENCLHLWKPVGHELDEGFQPTADVVEVVRCIDCEHRDKNCCKDGDIHCDIVRGYMAQDDYCSYGKHKEKKEHEKSKG